MLLVTYVVAAATMLPPWLVALTAGKADANTQLNAVSSTRAALLGVVTPIVLLFGGIAALLNYQETAEQNRRTNERAEKERDEERRLRRANVYADFTGAVERCAAAALVVFIASPENANYLAYLTELNTERRAVMAAHDRVRLLGADVVQAAASDIRTQSGTFAKAAMVSPKVAEDEWERVWSIEYSAHYFAFLNAARTDLEPTR